MPWRCWGARRAPDRVQRPLRAARRRGAGGNTPPRSRAPTAAGCGARCARLEGGGSVELVADVTELRRAEQAARFLAYHDALTGLPNRRLLDDRLRQACLARDAPHRYVDIDVQRRDRMVATLLVHLDDFRQVNDTLGHGAGDAGAARGRRSA